DGLSVLNYDNEITRKFAEETQGRITFFSRTAQLPSGVFLKDDAIWIANEQGERQVLPLADILLPGIHNVENYMAALGAVDGLVPDEVIRTFATKFSGVEHRIELVRTLNG